MKTIKEQIDEQPKIISCLS